jgi:ornithine cyclodeaminase/alanine dehydrogenase-like protein (mu-crystallin family)
VAAVGPASNEKQEIAPALMSRSKVVADLIDQCTAIGDLHHAIKAGAMRREDVAAELGWIMAGRRPRGRRPAWSTTGPGRRAGGQALEI